MAVSLKTRCIVWAKAAGRCQFPGCNNVLIGDLQAGNDTLNAGYVAHIVAEKPGGPRGHPVRSPELADDPKNLMLMCDPHHRLIDRDEVADYPEARLLQIKHDCEVRVELATSISPDQASHVVRYAARIGHNEGAVGFTKCREAMLPDFYPANHTPVDFSMTGVDMADNEPGYFQAQAQNLERQFNAKLRGEVERQAVNHISVFALAPIPLLMELGRLISDITPAEIHQPHREPSGWKWANSGNRLDFEITKPDNLKGPVALKLGVSSHISDERISAVLGEEVSIWSLSVTQPHNDCMRYREDLEVFRSNARGILAAIKHSHGEKEVINVFPALPVSAAIEFGRIWMPKADLPIRIYDQSRVDDGFIYRLSLGER